MEIDGSTAKKSFPPTMTEKRHLEGPAESPRPFARKKRDSETNALIASNIRYLCALLPQIAVAGHPGGAMGLAAIGHALFGHTLRIDPTKPDWWNRDRFVLSNGHVCALQYVLMHLLGFPGLTKQELLRFRQLGSITPGHPEAGKTPGVEVTTGPLGQGFAQAVGLAVASHQLEIKYNKPGYDLFTSRVICVVGDGCIQEGLTYEAASVAGHWGLSRLVVVYDYNRISIDGSIDLAFSEDVAGRFRSQGWNVLEIKDSSTDFDRIRETLDIAAVIGPYSGKPTFIIAHTIIGYGCSNQGSEKTHGAPLGRETVEKLGLELGVQQPLDFFVCDETKSFYDNRRDELHKERLAWEALWEEYQKHYPIESTELIRRFSHKVPAGVVESLHKLELPSENGGGLATRVTSGKLLKICFDAMPELMVGSADLTDSTNVRVSNTTAGEGAGAAATTYFRQNGHDGRGLYFGVREHAAVSICNGLYAFGGYRPVFATFLNFVTYGFPALRLSALSGFGTLTIATHCSYELGEDGPTHIPVEVVPLLRATPNLYVIIPADARETAAAYQVWLDHPRTPVVMCLTRGKVPVLENSKVEGVLQGAYVMKPYSHTTNKKVTLAASGREVSICLQAAKILAKNDSYDVRVVSTPCWELFDLQPDEYKTELFPTETNETTLNMYVEGQSPVGFRRELFNVEYCIGMNSFGVSAPADDQEKYFGFTPQHIVKNVTSFFENQSIIKDSGAATTTTTTASSASLQLHS